MSLRVELNNLVVETKNHKRILNEINLAVFPGELQAIQGPSGCGKTTLLDLIANRIQSSLKYTGNIQMNGTFKYVPQEEHLHGFYTVQGYLRHYLNLNYGFMSQESQETVINAILEDTGLASSKDTRVGDVFIKGLSGGQKRRLSIALELVGKPDILILDEPTSGLDSVSAYYVMLMLKKLTSEGVTVICTLHQPSSQIYEMLDKITFISKGNACFHGTLEQAEAFFASIGKVVPSHFNPSDYYLFQINTDFSKEIEPEKLKEQFHQWASETGNLNPKQISREPFNKDQGGMTVSSLKFAHSRSNFFSKFLFLIQRYFFNLFMNPGIIFVRLAMYLILCFIIGFMYFQLGSHYNQSDIVSRTSLLFYVDAFLVFMSIAVLPFFMIERGIVEKEIHNRLYSPIHYQVAMFITSLPGVAIIAIVSSLLVNLIANLNGFGIFFLILFLSLVCGESLAMLVSLVVPHYIIGMALVAGLYGVFMICQGFLIVRDNIPGYLIWVYYIGFHTYSFEGFMLNEFEPIKQFNSSASFKNGYEVLKFYGMENGAIWKDVVILIGYALILQVLIAAIMLFIFRRKRIGNRKGGETIQIE